jgi:hypothetical protein
MIVPQATMDPLTFTMYTLVFVGMLRIIDRASSMVRDIGRNDLMVSRNDMSNDS